VGCSVRFGRVARYGVTSVFVAAFVFPVAWATPATGETAQNADVKSESNDLADTKRVRVAGIVLKWLRTEKEANYSRAEKLITEAAQGEAKLVCTTECFLDGYAIKDKSIPLDEYRALGEPIPSGKYCRRLIDLADRLDIFLVAGLLEADGEARYNTAVLIDPDGKLIGKYRKQRLGHESIRNTPGTETPVFRTPFGDIGIMICADRQDAGLVKRLGDGGAQLLICPSGGMFGAKSNDPIVQARFKENGIPILFVHPAEFLVTVGRGEIQSRHLLGDRLEIANSEVGGEHDLNEVYFFDLGITSPSESKIRHGGSSTQWERRSRTTATD
jgi:predicted amidohydrolase